MANADNIRAAAYLATRERLDGRRTARVRCEPPNRQCGNRCIPPNWDCRLKGEGEDGHLRAVGKGSDPVAGFANIERGLGRIKKGALKLSFSEIEGGRRAIARGAAKLSPGDLQQKKELQERVNQLATYVGGPIAVVVFAGLAHRGLKAFPAYARGPGAQVDASISNVFRTVARNTPVYGRGVRAREAVGPQAINAMGRSVGRINQRGPDSFSQNPNQRRALTALVNNQPAITETGFPTEYSNLLDASLRRADGATNNRSRPSGASYSEWDSRSLKSFWSTERTEKVTPNGVNSKGSLFSVIAANDHVAKSFGMPAPRGSDPKREGNEIVARVRGFFETSGDSIRTSMREAGLDPKSPEAVRDFIGRSSSTTGLDQETTDILLNTVIGRDYDGQAKKFYAKVVGGYDKVFNNVLEDLNNAPSIELVANRNNPSDVARLRQLRQSSFYNDAVFAHSQQIGQRLGLPAPVYGPYTGLLAKRAYHTRFVAGPRKLSGNNEISLSLTRTEVFNAGIEIAKASNLPEPPTTEAALELVRRTYGQGLGQYLSGNAIGRIELVSGRTTSRSTPPSATGQERPARRRSRPRAQIVADLIRAGYTPEAAASEADRLIAERRRDARVDTYLQLREDFTPTQERKGKACGKSFIGRNEKCSKPGGKGYADPVQGQNASTGLMQNVGKAALAAGVVAGGVLAARKGQQLYRNRRNIEGYTRFAPKAMNAAITRLSQDDIRQGLAKVPKQFRPQAEKLVGKAKAVMAYVSADAQGYNLKKVNNESNFSTWSTDDGSRVLTVGSVGDTLVTFNADRSSTIDLKTEGGRGVGVYDVQFSSDLGFQQKKELSKDDQNGISKMLKTMNTDTMANLPKNAVLRNIPYAKDGLGGKRAAIYKRMKYKSIKGIRGEAMFATLDNGKVVAISPEYEDFYADLLKGDDYDTAVKKFQQRNRRDEQEVTETPRVMAYLEAKKRLGLAAA